MCCVQMGILRSLVTTHEMRAANLLSIFHISAEIRLGQPSPFFNSLIFKEKTRRCPAFGQNIW